MRNWLSVASLEDTTGQPATLMLQIASTPTVSLSIAPGTVTETAGANAATATLTRNGDLSTPLTVNLSSNNTSQLTVPASGDVRRRPVVAELRRERRGQPRARQRQHGDGLGGRHGRRRPVRARPELSESAGSPRRR